MYKLNVKLTRISDGGGAHPAPIQGVGLFPEQEEGLQGRQVLPASQVVSNAVDMKLRDDLERLKKIRYNLAVPSFSFCPLLFVVV